MLHAFPNMDSFLKASFGDSALKGTLFYFELHIVNREVQNSYINLNLKFEVLESSFQYI